MKKKTRTIALILVLSILVGLLSSCQPKEVAPEGTKESTASSTTEGSTSETSEKPPAGEYEEYTILTGINPPIGPGAWETPQEIPFYQEYQEETGIKINWDTTPIGNFTERLNLVIAGGDLPDAIMKGAITDNELIKYGTAGAFVDIKPLMAEHAPNLNAFVQEKDIEKYIRLGDAIYGMPYFYDSDGIRIANMFVNETWLKAVGMEAPGTIDEFLTVLRAFRTEDPNGNGDPTDEVPYGTTAPLGLLRQLVGAYGLANRGIANDLIDADPQDPTKIRYWRATSEMRDLLSLMRTMYDEKLVSTNLFAPAGEIDLEFHNQVSEDIVGFHATWATAAGELTDLFQPLPLPLEGPAGRNANAITGMFGRKGCFIITSSCRSPETMLSWADYFYSPEGSVRYLLGTEGQSYNVVGDGEYELTKMITENEFDLNQDQALLRWSLQSGGNNPTIATDKTFKGGETYPTSLQGSANNKPYIPKEVWLAFPKTEEQAQIIAELDPDLITVNAEYLAKFVVGDLDVTNDAHWQEYLDQLDKAQVDRWIAVQQEILDTLLAS